MPASPLLPPAGAEPGSVWLLVNEAGPRVATWDGDGWTITNLNGSLHTAPPSAMTIYGYRLSDPHGAAAAVAVLEAAGAMRMILVAVKNEHAVAANFSESVDGFRRATHPASFLAAALAAVREWEGRDG